jgi:hypothetical protein
MYCNITLLFNYKVQYILKDSTFVKKEKRNQALTVRLPNSIVKKIKKISKKYNYSQSEVIETLVLKNWNDVFEDAKDENEKEN